jgi:putative Holliday junction resolvase
MKLLAIDYGLKRTGLAVCDPSQTICSPYGILDSTKNLIGRLTEIIAEENVEAVVVGLPINMDDTEGPQAKTVREFAEKLKTKINIPVHFQDERLTSFAADEKLNAIEMSPREKKKRRDALAAAQILQAFLDNNQPEPG